MRLDTTTAVETPERVRFRYRLAGPAARCAAWLADLALQAIVVLAAAVVLGGLAGVPALSGVGQGLYLLLIFVLSWAYGAIFETLWSGQTPGKLLLSLRVVRVDGAPARFPDYVLRNLLKGVDFLPVLYGVGVVAMLLDEKMRRVGDLAAGTVVVVEEKTRMLGAVAFSPPISDEERASMPPIVRLRRDEIRAIEDLLRRRHRFSEARAEELAGYCAPPLVERTGVEASSPLRALTLAWARSTGRDRQPEPSIEATE